MRIGDVELLVETTPVAGSEPTSTLSRAQEAVGDAYDRAQEAIVVDVIEQLSERAMRPEQVEVRFGLKFSLQGNVVLAGASGEATLEVTLRYGTARAD